MRAWKIVWLAWPPLAGAAHDTCPSGKERTRWRRTAEATPIPLIIAGFDDAHTAHFNA
ncbi:hypothetical protein BCEP4_810016 [Burkholderia cepacia]|nr:hypothetical protein BCEP4_810016 [Burkholderia cepacia]